LGIREGLEHLRCLADGAISCQVIGYRPARELAAPLRRSSRLIVDGARLALLTRDPRRQGELAATELADSVPQEADEDAP
jgi:hypothetical protein